MKYCYAVVFKRHLMLEMAIIVAVLTIFIAIICVVQQIREKVKAAREIFVRKQKSIIRSTEAALMTSTEIPMHDELKTILQIRIIVALKNLIHSGAHINVARHQLGNALINLELIKNNIVMVYPLQEMVLFSDEQAVIESVQKIKEIRRILHSEHKSGVVESVLYNQEDRILSLMQTKLMVEAYYNRALSAKSNNMPGSARQGFERTLSILNKQVHQDNYIVQRIDSIKQHLQDIEDALLAKNQADLERRIKDEKSDVDILFEPKKKWR